MKECLGCGASKVWSYKWAMVNGPDMGSMGSVACSLIQSHAHFTVSARDQTALTHQDGKLYAGTKFQEGFVWGPGTIIAGKKGAVYFLSYETADTALWEEICLQWSLNTLGHLTVIASHSLEPGHKKRMVFTTLFIRCFSAWKNSQNLLKLKGKHNYSYTVYLHLSVFVLWQQYFILFNLHLILNVICFLVTSCFSVWNFNNGCVFMLCCIDTFSLTLVQWHRGLAWYWLLMRLVHIYR